MFLKHTLLFPLQMSLILLLVVSTPGLADPAIKVKQSAAELQALRDQIKGIKQDIEKSHGEHDALRKKLQESEIEIENAIAETRKLDAEVKEKNQQLEVLKKQQGDQSAALFQHKDFLKQQFRTAYMQQDHNNMLKLILNQEDAGQLSRMLVYHRYLATARSEKISVVKEQLSELIAMQKVINDETDKLGVLQTSQQQHLNKLQLNREQRQQLIANLGKKISGKDARLKEMKNNAGKLTTLISSLKKTIAQLAKKKLSDPGLIS